MPTVAMSRRSRPRAVVSRDRLTSSTRPFIFLIRSRMIRRSVSSCDSPGPRDPIPPWVRERWVQSRVRRGSWYSSWASSTWRRPSWVRACRAKMSRISRLRSMTFTLRRLSSDFCWPGDSSSSATRRSKRVSFLAATSSSALPFPTYQLGSTWRRFCPSAPPTSAPPAPPPPEELLQAGRPVGSEVALDERGEGLALVLVPPRAEPAGCPDVPDPGIVLRRLDEVMAIGRDLERVAPASQQQRSGPRAEAGADRLAELSARPRPAVVEDLAD